MTTITQVWDKTIQKSNEWIRELGSELGWEDPHAVLLALRAVLHALRDRLPHEEAADLAAQMPLLIKGVYFDGWRPGATPIKVRSKQEFINLVMQPLVRGYPDLDPERVIRAVFRILAERVSQGEIRDVRLALPAELAEYWPTGATMM